MSGCGCDNRVLVRRRLDAGGLKAWGQVATDDVGAAIFYEFAPCDHVAEVSIGLYGADGEPIETFGAIEAFWMRRRDARAYVEGSRDAATWVALRASRIGRSTLGGFAADSDQPREAMATNFGRGWDVGADWADDSPPALVVLWSYSTNEARPAVEVAYREGEQCLTD